MLYWSLIKFKKILITSGNINKELEELNEYSSIIFLVVVANKLLFCFRCITPKCKM